ncbi:MAG: hypothetical protein HGGPFJEG_00442 [Ignavibacteria bacterium]|nr:hypothetical protein [Ignavibacteria bacterium]
MKTNNFKITIFYLAILNLFICGKLFSQTSADDLAKQLSNPVANLISVPFQFNFQYNINDNTDNSYNGYKLLLNFQPVIPVSLSKGLNLINRVIVPVMTQKDVTSKDAKEEGLGDILYTPYFSPSNTKLIVGIAPAFSFPTATNDLLGSKKFNLGAGVVVLGQPDKWTLGGLVTQFWSVAGDDERQDVSTLFVQPFISYGFKGGFTLGVLSENTYDWKNKMLVSGLVQLTMSQVFKIAGKQVASIGLYPVGYYANKNIKKPEWGVRTVLTFIFPK